MGAACWCGGCAPVTVGQRWTTTTTPRPRSRPRKTLFTATVLGCTAGDSSKIESDDATSVFRASFICSRQLFNWPPNLVSFSRGVPATRFFAKPPTSPFSTTAQHQRKEARQQPRATSTTALFRAYPLFSLFLSSAVQRLSPNNCKAIVGEKLLHTRRITAFLIFG